MSRIFPMQLERRKLPDKHAWCDPNLHMIPLRYSNVLAIRRKGGGCYSVFKGDSMQGGAFPDMY